MRLALILVGLGTLAVMELEAPPRTKKPVDEPSAQTTVGSAVSRDTLTTTDRLDIPHMQHQAPAPSPAATGPVPAPDQPAIAVQEPAKSVDQPKRGANLAKSAVMLPRPRPKDKIKDKIAKTAAATNRAKPIVEGKSCRPNAFDGLLKALNLSSGCET